MIVVHPWQVTAIVAVFRYLEWVDSLVCRTPLAGGMRARVLDSLLGPAEELSYVSTTAPSAPPPTDS